VVYNPKAFIPHAASLRQACAHCGRFSTAATRRCLGSVSVPVSEGTLSCLVPIIALVGRYPANKLIGRGLIPKRNHTFGPETLSRITHSFPWLFEARGQMIHVFLSLTPLTVALTLSSRHHRVKPGGSQENRVRATIRTTCMPNPRRQRSF